jgi:membrane fusion protein (multidrug efflux system)
MLTHKQILKTLLFLSLAVLAACDNKTNSSPNAMANMPLPVSVLQVQSSSVPIQTEAVAQTEGAKEVEIRPRVGGILIKRMYNEGETVQAGKVMFQIDPAPFQIALQQAKANLQASKARFEQTSREEKRLKNLLATQSISQREYDNATTDSATAQASVLQAQASVREAELNLSYTSVSAPVNGFSGRFQFSEGALVSANTSLLTTISQINPIWVRFSLSESDLINVGGFLTEDKVKKVSLILPNGQEYSRPGKLNFSASQINPSIGTQELRATFDNPDHQLLPGQFVRARVVTGQRDGVYLLPQTAVLTGEQGKFVFVAHQQDKGHIAMVKPVKEVGWYQGQWVVTEGIQDGDQVIVDNLIKIRPGAPVNPHPFGQAPQAQSAPAAHPAK